jgi:hypothetical protein
MSRKEDHQAGKIPGITPEMENCFTSGMAHATPENMSQPQPGIDAAPVPAHTGRVQKWSAKCTTSNAPSPTAKPKGPAG